jgi:hypothetical protein
MQQMQQNERCSLRKRWLSCDLCDLGSSIVAAPLLEGHREPAASGAGKIQDMRHYAPFCIIGAGSMRVGGLKGNGESSRWNLWWLEQA